MKPPSHLAWLCLPSSYCCFLLTIACCLLLLCSWYFGWAVLCFFASLLRSDDCIRLLAPSHVSAASSRAESTGRPSWRERRPTQRAQHSCAEGSNGLEAVKSGLSERCFLLVLYKFCRGIAVFFCWFYKFFFFFLIHFFTYSFLFLGCSNFSPSLSCWRL